MCLNYKRIEWHDKSIEARFYGEIKKLYAYETTDGKYIITPKLRKKYYKTKSPKDIRVFVIQKKEDMSTLWRKWENGEPAYECKYNTLADAKRKMERLYEEMKDDNFDEDYMFKR